MDEEINQNELPTLLGLFILAVEVAPRCRAKGIDEGPGTYVVEDVEGRNLYFV